jgi:hypothetical protein
MNEDMHDAEDHEFADAGLPPEVDDADDYADEYALNDIGLALRLHALAD